MDPLEQFKQHLKDQENKAAALLLKITSDEDVIFGFQIFIKGGLFPTDPVLISGLKTHIIKPSLIQLKENTYRALVNTFIPDEIKIVLLLGDIPVFKSIGKLRKYNLENPEEIQIAYSMGDKINKLSTELLKQVIDLAGLTGEEKKVLAKIYKLEEGFEYDSREELTAGGLSQETIDTFKKDQLIIESLVRKLLNSYKEHWYKEM